MILASVIGTAVLCGCDNVMNAGTTEYTHEEYFQKLFGRKINRQNWLFIVQ
jgi:hypothetical protein